MWWRWELNEISLVGINWKLLRENLIEKSFVWIGSVKLIKWNGNKRRIREINEIYNKWKWSISREREYLKFLIYDQSSDVIRIRGY